MRNIFIGKNGGLSVDGNPICSIWLFKYVAQKTFPQFKFEAYLLMADKTKKSSIDGLNQMFRIPKMEIQERILSKRHSLKEIGNSVLSETNVDDIIDGIISNKYKYHETLDFEESITTFKKAYQENN
jgi:hypothetical protein